MNQKLAKAIRRKAREVTAGFPDRDYEPVTTHAVKVRDIAVPVGFRLLHVTNPICLKEMTTRKQIKKLKGEVKRRKVIRVETKAA